MAGKRKTVRKVYVLDTSVVRGRGKAVLQQDCVQGQDCYVSPYTFWELVRHLDASVIKDRKSQGASQFSFHKKQLMKIRYFKVLDAPRAEIEKCLLPKSHKVHARLPDYELIYPCLAALREAKSLDAFYETYIKDSRGECHEIRDCAKSAYEVLEEEQHRYIKFVGQIICKLHSGQVNVATPQDRHQAVLSMMEADVSAMKKGGASNEGLRDKLLNSTYVYWSYIFHRALKYSKPDGKKVDKNDYVDGCICRHLRLWNSFCFCLVTADCGFKEALEETKDLLNNCDIDNTIEVLYLPDDKPFSLS